MEKDLKGYAVAAGRRMLRSLIRMMIKHGVMHREFIELSKEVYVEVASNDYGIRGRPTNAARTALLTGLDRKEVARIRNKLAADHAPVAESVHRQDRISRVLAGWHQDPDYLNHVGPLVLPLEGPAPSFEALIKSYGGDVPAITILRELQRVGAVRVDDKKSVEVMRRNYRLDTAEPEALLRSGSVLDDIGATVTHNLYRDADEPSRFEARASNVALPMSALPAYETFLRDEGQEFLERVDAWLSEHEAPEGDARREKTLRVGVGLYWIQSDASEVPQ
ncbi:MAG TPA: DUF6502 family protein [Gammaproteobacteria bacterium]